MLCGLFFHIIKIDNDSSKNKDTEVPSWKSGRSDTTDRVQNRLSQNVPLCHEDYFELNAIKTQEIQKKLFTPPPPTAEIHIGKRACTTKRAITRDNF